MTKIIQTQINEAEIKRNNMRISQLYSHIKNLKEKNEKLKVTYFCGKEILYENKIDYENEHKKGYTLAVIMDSGKSFKMKCEVYRNMHNLNEVLYSVCVGECGVNLHYPKWWNDNNDSIRKHKHFFKSFEEAKETARMWLAEIIEKYGDEP